MESEVVSKEKLLERSAFELDYLKQSAEKARKRAVEYLKKINKEASNIPQMVESNDFKIKYLDAGKMTWVDHYSNLYRESIEEAQQIERILQDLRNTIQFVKDAGYKAMEPEQDSN